MFSKRILLACIIFTLGVFSSSAQDDKLGSKADHDALRTLKEKAVNAINNRDMKTLQECLAREFIFTAVDQTPITSIKAFEDFFKKYFDGPTALLISMKCQPEAEIPTRFLDSNTGVCYGANKESYKLKSGNEVTMDTRWTAVVVRQDGEWKVAAIHSGANFMDNPLLNKVMKGNYNFFVIGVIAGVLLGIMVMMIIRKMATAKKAAN